MRPKRTALPVVVEALDKALNQLEVAATAALLSGNIAMAEEIAAAARNLETWRDRAKSKASATSGNVYRSPSAAASADE